MKNVLHRNDKFVTIHNKCSKILPSNSLHLATRVNKIASCLSELIFMDSSIKNAKERCVLCILLSFFKTSLYIQHKKQKSNGVSSGGSHSCT
jgi:CRISPR/Cas system-associated protein Csx1